MQSSSPSVMNQTDIRTRSPRVGVRVISWSIALAIGPLLVLLLRLRPDLDILWQVPLFHTVVVSVATTLSVLLSFVMLWLADEQRDGRILLIGFALFTIASMFFVHAVAIPGTLAAGAAINSWAPTLGLSLGGALLALSGLIFRNA